MGEEIWLTLMLLVMNMAKTKMMQKKLKMTETLAHGYSSESTFFKNVCVLVLWIKVASALEGFIK